MTFPIAGDVESVIFKFADQPSFIEFSGELAGNKIDFIKSNAVIKTQNDCYLFDGEVTPQFTLFDVAGQELTIHCHYRFIGELTQTMKELLEAVKPLAQIEQRLMAQITSLKKKMNKCD